MPNKKRNKRVVCDSPRHPPARHAHPRSAEPSRYQAPPSRIYRSPSMVNDPLFHVTSSGSTERRFAGARSGSVSAVHASPSRSAKHSFAGCPPLSAIHNQPVCLRLVFKPVMTAAPRSMWSWRSGSIHSQPHNRGTSAYAGLSHQPAILHKVERRSVQPPGKPVGQRNHRRAGGFARQGKQLVGARRSFLRRLRGKHDRASIGRPGGFTHGGRNCIQAGRFLRAGYFHDPPGLGRAEPSPKPRWAYL